MKHRSRLLLALAAAGAASLALWLVLDGRPAGPGRFADAEDAALVERGAEVYARHCAECHGQHLEGQPNWQVADANGHVRAPPHDQTGHTWQHSDEEIFHAIKYSVTDTAAPGYVTDMPAFKGVLDDGDVLATIAFIKKSWPIGVRVSQAMLNPDFAGLPPGADEVEWHLPPTCQATLRRSGLSQ